MIVTIKELVCDIFFCETTKFLASNFYCINYFIFLLYSMSSANKVLVVGLLLLVSVISRAGKL